MCVYVCSACTKICVSTVCAGIVCVCVCVSWFSPCTIHILRVQQGGEPVKHSIALHYPACYQVEKTRTESGQTGLASRGGKRWMEGWAEIEKNEGERHGWLERQKEKRVEGGEWRVEGGGHGQITGREKRGRQSDTWICAESMWATLWEDWRWWRWREMWGRGGKENIRWVTGVSERTVTAMLLTSWNIHGTHRAAQHIFPFFLLVMHDATGEHLQRYTRTHIHWHNRCVTGTRCITLHHITETLQRNAKDNKQ